MTEPTPAQLDHYGPAMRRKNLLTLAIVAAVLVGAALIPATLRRVQQPSAFFATYVEAQDANAFEERGLPRLVPASATDIYVRDNRDANQRFARFTYPANEAEVLTRGMRRVPQDRVDRIMVPTPGWSRWWPITPRTLSGSQGERMEVYEVEGADRGYLALDPRTNRAYFWSR